MAVVSGPTLLTGSVGIKPTIKYMLTTDSLATITTAGYLNTQLTAESNTITPTDYLLIRYSYVKETNAGLNAFFNVSISNGVITLTEDTTTNSVTFTPPSIANHIATWTNTTGNLSQDAATAINAGNIQAGLSGTAGTFIAYPSAAASGSMVFSAAANTNAAVGTIVNVQLQTNTTFYLGTPVITPTYYLQGSINPSDPCSNLKAFNVTCTSVNLAAAGSVVLNTATTIGARYKLRTLFINGFGTNFSGGGGDRLGQVTDGTTVFSVIPAATMQSLVNAVWGSTSIPFPASAAIETATAAGANLVFKYSGGTLDYAAGSVVISGLLERVA